MMFTENDYELELINEICSIKGYEYKSQEEIIELRKNLSSVLLSSVLIESIKKVNKGISEENIYKVYQKVYGLISSSYIEGNKTFHKFIVDGVKIKDDKLDQTLTFKLFDIDNVLNNSFIVTNQFIMKSNHPQYENQRPDVLIYCNGIPIIVFELKGLSEENTLELAYKQIKNYQKYLSDLFTFNAFNIISNRSEVRFGTITSSFSRFQFWKGDNYENSSNALVKDLLNPEILLDVIKNFTFYTSTKEDVKIIASYHQYYGVKRAVDSSISAIENKNLNGKAGIFWHTQGSGKSFSMLFLVKQVAKIKNGTTFLIVTDRNDLDNQLYKTFVNAKDFIVQKIHQVDSIKDLTETLRNRKQDGVFFTTVQKFTKDVGLLSKRDDVLIISDEAHRSHNNLEGKLVVDSETKEIAEKQGSAMYLRDAFPNASFIGFTGTPVKNDDKSTEAIFGKIIDRYLMTDAERDGVVVPIRYESRKPELRFDNDQMNILVNDHVEIIDDIKKTSDLPAELTKKVNKAIQKLENFIVDPDRIKGIVTDFVAHYESRENVVEGKVMFVAFNRFVAFEYYKAILKLRPNWKEKVKLIITNSNGQSDSPELLDAAGTPEYRKRMAEEFKKKDSEFKIAIVVDMWLTGFDVPSLDAIYIDKPIKMHNLMQSIARTNRVYNDKKSNKDKEYGLVIDYIGLWSKLIEALSYYSGKTSDQVINERDILSLKPEYIRQVKKIYSDFGFDNILDFEKIANEDKSERFKTLDIILNKIYKDKKKQNFVSATKKVSSQFNEVISLLNEQENIMFQMLIVARTQIIKSELGDFDLSKKENRLIRQLQKTIKFDGTDIVAEIDSNPILLSKIIEHIQKPSPEEVAELDARLNIDMTKKLINYSKKKNFIIAQDLNRKLVELMNKYDSNYITMKELMESLVKIQKSIQELNSEVLNEKGFTQEELAFYEMLAKPIDDIPDFDRNKLELITKELLEIINNDEKVNKTWIFNEHLIQKVRKDIKVLMLKYGYPPKDAQVTTDQIISQVMYQKNLKGNN